MRLYNPQSCTPLESKTSQSPPKSFVPRQSVGYNGWKASKLRPVTIQRDVVTQEDHHSTSKREPPQTSSPNTATTSKDMTPEVLPSSYMPSSDSYGPSRDEIQRINEKELLDTLPALRELDAIMSRAILLAGVSDESSFTTLSTLSTKLSMDAVSNPHEIEFALDGEPFSFEKCEWPPKQGKARSKDSRDSRDLPWPAEAMRENVSPQKLLPDDSSPSTFKTGNYASIRAGLRKVEAKDSPAKEAITIQSLMEESARTINELCLPPRQVSKKVAGGEITGFHAFQPTFKETDSLDFDDEFPLDHQSPVRANPRDEIFRLHAGASRRVSNASTGRWPQEVGLSPPAPTKKVLFRMPEDTFSAPPREINTQRNTDIPPKDDPKFAKYFRMLKMGLPMGAVENSMRMDGLDPSVLNGDSPVALPAHSSLPVQQLNEKVRHFRIHWETHNRVGSNTVWDMVKDDPDLANITLDQQEVKDLFRCDLKVKSPPATRASAKVSQHTAVKVIDSKRANNGGITLARIKLTYAEIARAVDNFDQDAMNSEQIRGLMDFIPTPDEKSALRRYLRDPHNSRTMLCECEKFMVAMMTVKHANRKLSAILFIQNFSSCLDDLARDARVVQKACDEIISSTRFRKILGLILTLGNQLNAAGSNGKAPAAAIKLDSLLKLDQAKAFDKQTTFLHFVVTNIRRNQASLVHFKDDMPSVFKIEKMQWSLVSSEMQRMEKGLDEVRKIALYYSQVQAGMLNDDAMTVDSSTLSLSHEVELLQTTSIGRFTLDACLRMAVLVDEMDKAKERCHVLFDYLGEDRPPNGQPDEVFNTVSKFGRDFGRALEDVIAREKAQVREMRGVPVVRCATMSFDASDPNHQDRNQSKGKFRWRRRIG